jgi:hypothetical protein
MGAGGGDGGRAGEMAGCEVGIDAVGGASDFVGNVAMSAVGWRGAVSGGDGGPAGTSKVVRRVAPGIPILVVMVCSTGGSATGPSGCGTGCN